MEQFDDRWSSIQIPSLYMHPENVPGTTEGILLLKEPKSWLDYKKKMT